MDPSTFDPFDPHPEITWAWQPPEQHNYPYHSSSHAHFFYQTDPSFQAPLQGNGNGGITASNTFDPFVSASTPLGTPGAVGPVSSNPYAHDPAAALGGTAFFGNQTGFQQPVCYFLNLGRYMF